MNFDAPPADPLVPMREWLAEAEETGLINPAAMTLATVDVDGGPGTRMVLLKGLDERGAAFYTNRESRKGVAMSVFPRASLLFHWDSLARQLMIEGMVSKIGKDESDKYFASRPRGNQVGAWASKQSQPLGSRAELEERVREVEERFAGKEIPRPPFWGGYRVSLDRIEFWQGHAFRLHDRLLYMPAGKGVWKTQHLYP